MKVLVIIGVILIVFGVAALAYEGITYTRSRTIVDIGPLKARVEEQRTVPVPPAVALAVIAGGLVLVLAGWRAAGNRSAVGGEGDAR